MPVQRKCYKFRPPEDFVEFYTYSIKITYIASTIECEQRTPRLILAPVLYPSLCEVLVTN